MRDVQPCDLDDWYHYYVDDLSTNAPDGILEVDLGLLEELDLLSSGQMTEETPLSHNFYVMESEEKLTLFNEKYVVWIVPRMDAQIPMTYTLIAKGNTEKLSLEMVLRASGEYNRSDLILRILEKFLDEIDENEQEMQRLT